MLTLTHLLQRLSPLKRALEQLSIVWTLCASLTVLLLLHMAQVFAPSGRWLYDHASEQAYQWHWSKQAIEKGVYQQHPVLIAIDETSLQTLGRWPWSRRVHAQLVNTLASSATPPSLMAWDVVFSEPHTKGVQGGEQGLDSDDDAIFTRAINNSRFPILLATQFEETTYNASQTTQSLRLIAPRAPLNSSVARIAHIHIDADVDGSVRRYWPEDTRLLGVTLPYLGSAMLAPKRAYPINQLTSQKAQQPHTLSGSQRTGGRQSAHIQTAQSQWLYPMPAKWVRQVSYQDILSGAAPSSLWAGVPVLVAATAKGLGDQYVSHLYQPSSVVAGGELVLGAMHTEQLIAAGLPRLSMAHWAWESLGLLILMSGVLYGLRRCEHIHTQLGVLILGLTAVTVFCVTVLAYFGLWFNAALLGVGVVVSWMLWVSHALNRFVVHIQRRLKQLGNLPTTFSHRSSGTQTAQTNDASNAAETAKITHKVPKNNDAIGGQLSAVTLLEQRQQTEFTRLNQVLDMLPDAAFVLNANAGLSVYLHNLAARQLCLRCTAAQLATHAAQTTLSGLLADFVPDLTHEQHSLLSKLKAQAAFQWQDLLTHHAEPAFAQGIEANSTKGERFLIKVAQLLDAQTTESGSKLKSNFEFDSESESVGQTNNYLIVSVIDLSVGLMLAQSRERTLNFLSHDIRAPQANIVALIDLEKSAYPDLEGVFSKIQFQAQRTLHLAEGFVQWSQASHRPAYQFIEYNLNELMIDALDEQWASAKRKGIHLTGYSGDDALWVMLDRSLLWRALVNLISNALNACVTGQEIRLSTRQVHDYAVIAVEDNGPGIPAEQHMYLFEPFLQGAGLKRTGAGLGLAFVKNVMDQHQGLIKLHSPVFNTPQPHGTRFELWIPLAPEVKALEAIEPL